MERSTKDNREGRAEITAAETSAPAETVTAVTPLPRDPNSRDVRVGDRVVARLRAIDAEALRLEVGVPWTPVLAEAVAEALRVESARRAALSLLARRALSAAETTDRLVRKGNALDTVQRIVAELTAQGWIDDAAVARDTAAEILRKAPAARAYLQHRIEARGIDATLAARVAEEATADRDPVESALEVARARLPGPTTPTKAQARRTAAILTRRGFDGETIGTVLDRLGLLDLDDRDEA